MSNRSGPNEKKPSRNYEVDRARLLEFFLANPDRVLKNSELRLALGDDHSDSWTRRLRELREPRHGGYTILSVRDRKGLRSDEYMFPAQERREPIRTARISGRVRTEVLHRDAYTCQHCGLARGQRYEDGRHVTVHVHHNVADSHGGDATEENCWTLCSRCNEGESNVGPARLTIEKTMSEVRRQPRFRQQEIFEYLKSVFES